MKLLTDELRARLPPLYSQEAEAEPMVYAKFFMPGTGWTWYVTEGSPQEEDFLFFGFVVGLESEFGYFLLSELESVRNQLGLRSGTRPGVPRRQAHRCRARARFMTGAMHTETKNYFLVSFLRLLTGPRFTDCSGRGSASQIEIKQGEIKVYEETICSRGRHRPDP